jgi:signal transduction histidine kinase
MTARLAKAHTQYERRLYGALLALLVTLIALGCDSYRSLVSIDAQRNRLTELYSHAVGLSSDLRYLKSSEDGLVSYFILSGDPKIFEKIESLRGEFNQLKNELAKTDSTPATQARVKKISALAFQLSSNTDKILNLRASGTSQKKALQTLQQLGVPLNDQLTDEIGSLVRNERTSFMSARERVNLSTDALIRSFIFVALAAAGGVILILLLMLYFIRNKKAHDNTQKQLFEQIKKTAQARKEVLETVSHDLKNPLTSVELSLQFLQRKSKTGVAASEVMDFTATALQATHAMKDLIQSLLDQAKRDAGTVDLDVHAENLLNVIESVKVILRPLADQKMIQIQTVSNADEIPLLLLDQRKITQVISNILGNAIKFTPEGGRILIETAREDDQIRVSISDTGRGIPPHLANQVFERFWQVSETSKQGTGLGLAIAKAVIDAHHGKIWVESEPGRGATFSFTLPILSLLPNQDAEVGSAKTPRQT